ALQLLAEAGEEHEVRRRHAQAVQALFAAHDKAYYSPQVPRVDSICIHAQEKDNLRAALDWCTHDDPVLGLAILGTLGDFYHNVPGMFGEVRRYYERFAPHAIDGEVPAHTLACFQMYRAATLDGVNDGAAREAGLCAARLFHSLGDAPREYVARGLLCKVTCLTMSIADGSRELDQMLSLERKDWPARILTEGRAVEAIVLNAQGRFKEAVRAYEQVIVLMRQAGAVRDTPQWLANLAHFHLDAGEIDLAIAKAREVVAVADRGSVD